MYGFICSLNTNRCLRSCDGFRILFYMVNIWDAQRRGWEDAKVPENEWRFRPIIPIVLYTGSQRWEMPLGWR